MRYLIVEDDFVSRRLLHDILMRHGHCDVAVNGIEAVEAFKLSHEEGSIYDLICLDIRMPEMDGQEALEEIRKFETTKGIQGLDRVKIIMTTALDDSENVFKAFNSQCEGYLVKPIQRKKLLEQMQTLGLLPEPA